MMEPEPTVKDGTTTLTADTTATPGKPKKKTGK